MKKHSLVLLMIALFVSTSCSNSKTDNNDESDKETEKTALLQKEVKTIVYANEQTISETCLFSYDYDKNGVLSSYTETVTKSNSKEVETTVLDIFWKEDGGFILKVDRGDNTLEYQEYDSNHNLINWVAEESDGEFSLERNTYTYSNNGQIKEKVYHSSGYKCINTIDDKGYVTKVDYYSLVDGEYVNDNNPITYTYNNDHSMMTESPYEGCYSIHYYGKIKDGFKYYQNFEYNVDYIELREVYHSVEDGVEKYVSTIDFTYECDGKTITYEEQKKG